MPMSQAAMDGISANGHRWKHNIRGMKPYTQVLGNANDANSDGNDYDRTAVEKAVQRIVKITRSFAERCSDSNIADRLRLRADDLECVEDCDIEDINHAMSDLYDDFDFYRILVN